MRVVDDHCEGLALGGQCQQAEQRSTDRKALGNWTSLEGEHHGQRVRLGLGQSVEQCQEGRAQLVEPAEGHLALRLDPPNHQDAHLTRELRDLLEQSGLAEAGVTRDHEHTAVTDPGPREEPLDRPLLGHAPHEHVVSVGAGPRTRGVT